MKSKEEILYDCTGMIAENHRTVIQAMEIHAAEVRTETIAETRSEMMDFAEWTSDLYFDGTRWVAPSQELMTTDELFSYWLTNIKGK